MSELYMRPGENLNEYDERLKGLFEAGRITADQFCDACAIASGREYLSRENPRAQSGHGSDVYRWRNVRWLILEAICGDGSFIDVGCANGHLIESLDKWMDGTDVNVEFHGLEISSELFELAQQRLPEYRSRLYHGNALSWKPLFQFDYVYTMILPDFPLRMKESLLANLFEHVVKPGGRLILGPWSDTQIEADLDMLGYSITGYCEKKGTDQPGEIKRVVWIDKHLLSSRHSQRR